MQNYECVCVWVCACACVRGCVCVCECRQTRHGNGIVFPLPSFFTCDSIRFSKLFKKIWKKIQKKLYNLKYACIFGIFCSIFLVSFGIWFDDRNDDPQLVACVKRLRHATAAMLVLSDAAPPPVLPMWRAIAYRLAVLSTTWLAGNG